MNNYMFQQVLQNHSNEVFIGGSIPGHVVINHDHETANDNLFHDYFSATSHFNDAIFRHRYRISRNLFLRIIDAIKDHDMYFEQRIDALGRFGLSSLQKLTDERDLNALIQDAVEAPTPTIEMMVDENL
ncbi:hypothetical protein H5410_035222, partial [Solanum commersonii]